MTIIIDNDIHIAVVEKDIYIHKGMTKVLMYR